MGGQITVESEVGKGTGIAFTAEFELPPAAKSLPQECGMAGIRVLVIEANRTTSGFLNRLLRARGMIAATVDSVPEALRALEDRGDEFDVILLDTQIGDREAIESITVAIVRAFRSCCFLILGVSRTRTGVGIPQSAASFPSQ